MHQSLVPSQRIASIDGLRALAILAVIAFHVRPTLLNGGFIGVSVFFVISGLVTTLSVLRAQHMPHGFAYHRYVWRRLKRLAVPILALLALALPAVYFGAPAMFMKLRADAVPAATFSLNWVYIFRKMPYFATSGLPSPLTHVWFMAVIMQFALLLPLLVFIARKLPRWARFALLLVLIGLSTASMMYWYEPMNTAHAYYGLDARLAELLVGSLLAFIVDDEAWQTSRVRRAVGHIWGWLRHSMGLLIALGGLAALGWMAFAADGYATVMFQGGFLAVALIAAIVLAASMSNDSWASKVLSIAPLRFVGARAMALYLVHFPLLEILIPATRTTPLVWWEWCCVAGIIVLVAEVFYRLVDVPAHRLQRLAIDDIHTAPVESVEPAQNMHPAENTELAKNAESAENTENVKEQLPERSSLAKDLDKFKPRRGGTSLSAWCLALLGLAMTMAVMLAPLNWQALVAQQSRGVRSFWTSYTTPPAPPQDARHRDIHRKPVPARASQTHLAVLPIAAQVPEHLPTDTWEYDAVHNVCSANPFLIGDSVAKGALAQFQQFMPHALIDAHESRSTLKFDEVFHQHSADGASARVLVVALGTNNPWRGEAELEHVVSMAQGKPLYFVTMRAPVAWQDANNRLLHQFAASHPQVGLIDWYAASAGHPAYFYDDGTHLTPGEGGGRIAYEQLIQRAFCGH